MFVIAYKIKVAKKMENEYIHCLFSNQILTRRSHFPDVAKSVPSGEKAIWKTGVAVRHFQTQSQPCQLSSSASGPGPDRLACDWDSPPISNVTPEVPPDK